MTEVPSPLYLEIMKQIDRQRRRRGFPSWMVDDLAGTQDGYYQKMLHATARSGRQAGWIQLQYVLDALYPHGVRLKLTPRRKYVQAEARINSKSRLGPRERKIATRREFARLGGKARWQETKPEERSKLLRAAAQARWAKVNKVKRTDLARMAVLARWEKRKREDEERKREERRIEAASKDVEQP